jgi:hypothetical protein
MEDAARVLLALLLAAIVYVVVYHRRDSDV